MIPEVIASLLGAAVGAISGLIPGLHPNLIAAVAMSSGETLTQMMGKTNVAIVIITLSLANSISNFIPACFLGAPESDNCLTTMPGHRYLKKGKAHEAVILTIISSILSIVVIIGLAPILIAVTPKIYESIKSWIPYLLMAIVVFLLMREKHSRVLACIVFILSGVLGIITLNMNNINEPLLPLLSGLFGIPALLLSIKTKQKIPPQATSFPQITLKTLLKTQVAATGAGYIFSVLPSLGPSQAAILTSSFMRLTTQEFLMLSGALGTVNMMLSIITWYSIGKARNGSVAAVTEMLTKDKQTLMILAASVLIGIIVVAVVMLFATRMFVKLISRVNYTGICLGTIAFITLLIVLIAKPMGLLIAAVACCIGLVAYLSDIQKNHLMGALMVPTILFFLMN